MSGEETSAEVDLIPIRVISLRRATDRREAMSAHLAGMGLPFSFFDAFDGREMTAGELAAMRPGLRLGEPLSPAVIGLAASFKRLFEEIAGGEAPFVCILEDDARLAPQAIRFLDRGALASLPRFDFLRLGHRFFGPRGLGRVRVARVGGEQVVAPIAHGVASHAQIVSRQGAAKALDGLTPLWGPIDVVLYSEVRMPLRILETRFPISSQGGFASDIDLRGKEEKAPVTMERRASREAAIPALKRAYRQAWGLGWYARARLLGR